MKRFVKVSLITAVIVMLIGIIIFVIGYVGGGQKDVGIMVEKGELSYRFGFGGPEAKSAPDKPAVADTSTVMTGSGEACLNANNVKKMDIEIGGGELYIERGDVETIQISAECDDKFEGYIEDNTLYIKGFDLEGNFFEWTDWEEDRNSVRIIVPKGLVFNETDISLGAGMIEITDITLGDTDVEIGAGELQCRNTKSGQLAVELGAGAVHMEAIEAGETGVSVALGEAVLNGSFNKNMDLECSMGRIEIVIDGKEEEFNYSMEAAMGSVEVAGNSYTGIASEKNIDNGADKTISAVTAMGDIAISFAK